MRVEIKNKDVMESIYALSALQGYVELPERERALLQEDQREGLMVLVGDAFSETVLALMPRVKDFGLPDDDDAGDMWIELKNDVAADDGAAVLLGGGLARGIAAMVLSAIYEGRGGDVYERRGRRALEMVIDTIDYLGVEFPRLLGWR